MNQSQTKQHNLPVLTDVAVPQAVTLSTPSAGEVVASSSVVEPDPGGYDPYNHAPPLPTDERAY